ncbi:MAG: PIN domain-containing protein, partial [FCB group bacterium]
MRILLDTNAYSELLRGNDLVLEWLENSEIIILSIIVIAELLTGFKGGTKEKKNNAILQDFATHPKVQIVNASLKTAQIFSEIKHYLKLNGKPMPINDIWIASQSIEFDAKLIS